MYYGGVYQFHVGATRTHPEGLNFSVKTAKEALHRMRRLQAQGFGVPQYAIDRLEAEVTKEQ